MSQYHNIIRVDLIIQITVISHRIKLNNSIQIVLIPTRFLMSSLNTDVLCLLA